MSVSVRTRRWALVGGTIVVVLFAAVLGLKAKVERDWRVYAQGFRPIHDPELDRHFDERVKDIDWVSGWRVYDWLDHNRMCAVQCENPLQKPRYWLPTACWPTVGELREGWLPLCYWDWSDWSWKGVRVG